MTAAAATARETAEEYVRAWLARDAEKALSFIADDVVCEAPGGHIEGVEGYRQFLAPFVAGLTGGRLLDVLVSDDTHAATLYKVDVPFAKDFRGMEYLTVKDGRITEVVSVFDLSPVIAAGAYPQG
ncbi:nuclear transport factor 2 family protein [Actinacidiphila acididurans]|uniref:Nuclear transport factor 2 family protein n=1 Tax=Actinacidiphila acididurans TaxID=2784346 RepID=A0ABS2TTF8_9ACTN|nr:nuclear transport factor 2 family protein [Actinacidiphila acididurans]MBM9506620.1 nuclear transport factor 2 family protein [Actinacidiphila acididurans]